MMLFIVSILAALTLVAVAFAIYYLQMRRGDVSERLKKVIDRRRRRRACRRPDGDDASRAPSPSVVSRAGSSRVTSTRRRSTGSSLRRVTGISRRGRSSPARGFSRPCVFGLGAMIGAWKLNRSPQEILILALVGVLVGFFVPMMIVRAKQSKRQREITLALPDALDLLVICVEAGQGLNAALLKVGRESELQAKALAEELRQINNEMRAGVTRIQALRNFALRTGVDEVRALVAVMVQSDRFGTSVAQALRTHAESLRIRRRQRAEEIARKAPVKLVFPLVFCIFPELLVVILAPGMLALFRVLSKMAHQ